MNEHDYSGQLPKADRNSELQQLSINALNAALPVDKFVLRDERINDAGVDASLELKIDSRYTNLRAQIQLKSTDSNVINQDGSMSVQVRVSNLNYLLNGQSPLYILYVAPRNELRFAWARDERKRLDEANPNWIQQEHINIRFNSFLTPETLGQIHKRIQKEARLQRKITDTLSRASNTDSLVIGINPETLNITEPDKARRTLLSSGTLIVTAGYSEQVRNLSRLLDLKTAQMPRILLVRAYAEYMLSRFQSAYALLSEAMLSRDELSADDQQFLDFLRDGCDYQAGKITLNELAARIDKKEQYPTDGFALSYRVEQLRHKALLNPDPISQRITVEELRVLVTEILKAEDTSAVFKLSARCALLEVRGHNVTRTALIELGEARLKLELGGWPDIPKMVLGHLEQFRLWDVEMSGLTDDVERLGHPNLIAQTRLQRSVIHFQYLANQRAVEHFSIFQITVFQRK